MNKFINRTCLEKVAFGSWRWVPFRDAIEGSRWANATPCQQTRVVMFLITIGIGILGEEQSASE